MARRLLEKIYQVRDKEWGYMETKQFLLLNGALPFGISVTGLTRSAAQLPNGNKLIAKESF